MCRALEKGWEDKCREVLAEWLATGSGYRHSADRNPGHEMEGTNYSGQIGRAHV